ncbi:MAG: lytic transglycosylase domain-containing protein [Alphaproteobacteria bacterium]|nr:lytic transglycosylase domain-containing protein [Alphaproteobacteria bacterium]
MAGCLVVSVGAAASQTGRGLPAVTLANAAAQDVASADRPAHDVGLPKILTQADVGRYRRIFTLQETGKWKAADRLIKTLDNDLLMGHVLFQRYMHPRKYRSKYLELKDWLAQYADHPGAARVHKLALRRRPKNYRAPRAPVGPRRGHGYADWRPEPHYRSPRKRNAAQRRRVRQITSQIRRNVRREYLTVSQKYLARKDVIRALDVVERDALLARVAAGWFYRGNATKALALAGPAADRSRRHISNADWIAGLSAWRLKQYGLASRHFEALARSSAADDWNRAAGAFWAARAYLVDRQPERVNPMLHLASEYPRTFHGLIAARQLGVDLGLQWTPPPLTAKGMVQVDGIPGARRAIALVQVGRVHLAERELRRCYLGGDQMDGPALLALAHKLNLPAMQLRMAYGVRGSDDRPYDRALFPMPPWQPAKGFAMDRALLFAFMRQESGFNARAKSPVGARGLMQLMPRTASYVAKDRSLRRRNRAKLFDPEFNLELGQKYLGVLLQDDLVKGDLFRLAVAYNAGPGNLSKWLRKAKFDGDPLLFVESIPWRESRLFVERVLTNFWIYRERFSQDSPSLDAAATGHWPIYFNLDNATTAVARNARN